MGEAVYDFNAGGDSRLTITDPKWVDTVEMSLRLRDADKVEMRAITDMPYLDLVQYAIDRSASSKVARVNGELLCMWGIGAESMLSGVGRPWLLGTDLMYKHPHVFLNGSKQQLQSMLNQYSYLRHYVDKRNTTSIHWLKWLGFEIGKEVPLGRGGEVFYEFTRGNI